MLFLQRCCIYTLAHKHVKMPTITWELVNSEHLTLNELRLCLHRICVDIETPDLKRLRDYCWNNREPILQIAHEVASLVPQNILAMSNSYQNFAEVVHEPMPGASASRPYLPMIAIYRNAGITKNTQSDAGCVYTVRTYNGIEQVFVPKLVVEKISVYASQLLEIKCWFHVYLRLRAEEVDTGDINPEYHWNKLTTLIPTQLMLCMVLGVKAVIKMPMEMYMLSVIVKSAIDLSHSYLPILTSMVSTIYRQQIINTMQMKRNYLESFLSSCIHSSKACCRILMAISGGMINLHMNTNLGLTFEMAGSGPNDRFSGKKVIDSLRETLFHRNLFIDRVFADTQWSAQEGRNSRGRSTIRSSERIGSSSRTRSTASGLIEYALDKLSLLDPHSFVSKESSRHRSQTPSRRVGEFIEFESRNRSRSVSAGPSRTRSSSNSLRDR
jgi:hypothetical protein